MQWKILTASFLTVLLAEMGDKTQLAALSLTAESGSPISVLVGACSALVVATVMGVALGSLVGTWVPPWLIKKAAAFAFIAVGGLMLWGKI